MTKFLLVVALAALLCLTQAFPAEEIEDRNKVIIRQNTPENIKRLANLGKDDLAEELSGQFEGDILLTEDELRSFEQGSKNKAGLIATRYRWAGAVVPYRIVEKDFTPEQIEYIRLGAKRMEEVTCLRFVEFDENIHNDWVTVQGSASGCFSSVGRRGTGEQILNLAPNNLEVGCFRLYTIVHEFMHAVGFYHMQSATNRDEYVRIEFDKIQAGTANNFNIYSADVVTDHNIEYDYGSMMHYSKTAFSIDGSDTIIALKPLNGEVMGQRVRMSEMDIARLNSAYCGGPEYTTTTVPETTKPPSRPNPIIDWINNLLRNILGGIRP